MLHPIEEVFLSMGHRIVGLGCRRRGFALVDALVALTIFATTLTLALGAETVGRKLAASAQGTRAAAAMLDYLIGQPLGSLGEKSGSDHDLTWRVGLADDGRAAGTLNFDLCRQTASVTLKASARTFSAATLAPCPAESSS